MVAKALSVALFQKTQPAGTAPVRPSAVGDGIVLVGRPRFAGTLSTKAMAIGATDRPSKSRSSRSSAAAFSLFITSPLPIAFFFPWIAAIVIAVLFPKARPVARDEFDALHPFRALPEIELRHDRPHRPAMLARQRLALPG